MTPDRRGSLVVAALLLALPALAGCGVDTQPEPEQIPVGGLPSELREPRPEHTPGGP